MPRLLSASAGPLPRWLIIAGSAAIVYHLAAIIIPVLDAPSGPWPTPMSGGLRAEPPAFAHAAAGVSFLQGRVLRAAHSYEFVSDRPGEFPAVEFDVVLRNEQGEVTRTLHFPDPHANRWVRHRQAVLATSLAMDLPVAPPGSEVIAAPGTKPSTEQLWMRPNLTDTALDNLKAAGVPKDVLKKISPLKYKEFETRESFLHELAGLLNREETERYQNLIADQVIRPGESRGGFRLCAVPQFFIPRTRGQVERPSDWSLILAHSFSRYLCRTQGAASAEVIRRSRDPVSYNVLLDSKALPDPFFKLTGPSLATLRAADTPETLIGKLRPLAEKDRAFDSRDAFLDELRGYLSQDERDRYQNLVVISALPPASPEFVASFGEMSR